MPVQSTLSPEAVIVDLEEKSAIVEQPNGYHDTTTKDQHSFSARYRGLQDVYDTCSFVLIVSDSSLFEEAVKSVEWQSSTKEEMHSIKKNQTWELTELPDEKHTVGLKWIFKSKYHADGTLHKRKACLLAKQYTQWQGIDFDVVFSPVA